jgi:two-component system cell cycle response regulator
MRERGHHVTDVGDAASAVELALSKPPDVVVTDLWMPGISGLQLCRLLRSERATREVPVVLLTASDGRKSRFWARHAGAAAYVTKSEIDRLLDFLDHPTDAVPSLVASATRGTVPERLSQLLDAALYDSTIAGQVRALAQHAASLDSFFQELASLLSELTVYRWCALSTHGDAPTLHIHTHPTLRDVAVHESSEALLNLDAIEPQIFSDDRTTEGGGPGPALVHTISLGTEQVGSIAISFGRRSASEEDAQLISLVASELGGPLRMATLIRETQRIAATDPLTELMNRRAFVQAMDRERSRASRHGFPLSLLVLDVDHFKEVNDTYGHDAGDVVLRGLARVLTEFARKSDWVVRWGGEEFVLALPQTSEAGARIVAERVRGKVANTDHRLPNGKLIRVTISVGLASVTARWELDAVVARADKALYAAKAGGRNRVEVG